MRIFFTFKLLVSLSVGIAQSDTIFMSLEEPNKGLYNQNFSTAINPFTDMIYSIKDSTEFNGWIIMESSGWTDSTFFTHTVSYYVIEGISNYYLIFINGIMSDSTNIGSDLNHRYEHAFQFNSDGSIFGESHSIDGIFDGEYFTTIDDSIQLKLHYSTDTLIDVLNNDVIYVNEDHILISEEDFIDSVGIWGNWNYTPLTAKEKVRCPEFNIIFYIIGSNDDFNPHNKKHRRKVIRKTVHNTA